MNTIERKHRQMAEALLKETHANNGLAPLDLKQFWIDQECSQKDPFGTGIPQVPIDNCMVSSECVFAELGLPEDWHRFHHDRPWVAELSKKYNDQAEKIIGRRPLDETPGDPNLVYPQTSGLHGIFEAQQIWHNESFWLMQSADTPAELEALLNRVEAKLPNLRDYLLPNNWESEKKRLLAQGIKPPLYRHQRGPVTFATSIFGVENLLYLIMDQPELAQRFSHLILRVMLEIARILDEEAGYSPASAPHGFSFCDDNCCLLSPDMYELFGFPVLEGMFKHYAPAPADWRYQHSDSAMGHLLPILSRLNFSMVNFGPSLTVAEIRAHMPHTVIQGQLAPFTYSRNEELNIICEFLRDFEMAREKRGLLFATAGSINNGSRLTGARLIMAAVQRYGRYS